MLVNNPKMNKGKKNKGKKRKISESKERCVVCLVFRTAF